MLLIFILEHISKTEYHILGIKALNNATLKSTNCFAMEYEPYWTNIVACLCHDILSASNQKHISFKVGRATDE